MTAQLANHAPHLEVYRDLFGEGWCAEYAGWIAWDLHSPIEAVALVTEKVAEEGQ